jgi:hypothetical protein
MLDPEERRVDVKREKEKTLQKEKEDVEVVGSQCMESESQGSPIPVESLGPFVGGHKW